MLNPSANRLGTRSAFSVLARARQLAASGKILSIWALASQISEPPAYCRSRHQSIAGWRAWLSPSMGLPEPIDCFDDIKMRYQQDIGPESLSRLSRG